MPRIETFLALATAFALSSGAARAASLHAPPSPSSEAKTRGVRVRVKGFARVDAHAGLASGRLVVSGTATDDAGRAASGADVTFELTRDAHEGDAVPLASALPESCGDASKPPALDGPNRLLLAADAAGRFCVRLSLPKDRYVAQIGVRASESLDGSGIEMPVDLSLKPVTLRFDPERSALSLDEEANVDVVATTEQDGVTTPAAGLWLTLANEAGVALGGATTNASGRAHFAFSSIGSSSTLLGQPGKGELRATFAGNADLGASTDAIAVERSTRVDLAVPDLHADRRPVGSPEDGIPIPVIATARCARLGCVGAPTGAVEARVGEMVVGAATLERGEARVVATFGLTAAAAVPLRLRFAPDAPWFRPTGDLEVTQPVKGQSPRTTLPLALAGLGAIAWLVMVRMPRRAAPRPHRSGPPRERRGGARVELLRGDSTQGGWRGHVVDADEGTTVSDACISIERRGFERVDVMAKATSDPQGMFVLAPIDCLPGDELVTVARLHAPLRGAVPSTGELRVALVLRRRALLDRLVAWTRRRGRPFDALPEPTPGQVRRAAGLHIDLVRWADAVERAAYGGGVVDEQAQREVDRLEPSETAGPGGAAEEPPSMPKAPRR